MVLVVIEACGSDKDYVFAGVLLSLMFKLYASNSREIHTELGWLTPLLPGGFPAAISMVTGWFWQEIQIPKYWYC